MDKSIAVRRKAQKLARKGQIAPAIQEMELVVQSGAADPYDFVFHGDLLVRGKRMEDAISSFREAVSAYERVGLYRNAIAIAKKILRADPTGARTHQRLGDLYAKEGLMGESIAHYLAFLDKAGGEVSGEEFIETLERVAEVSGPRVEIALRLAELYVRAGKEDRAAALLEDVARQAEANGAAEIAGILRGKARELIPPPSGSAGDAGSGEPSSPDGTRQAADRAWDGAFDLSTEPIPVGIDRERSGPGTAAVPPSTDRGEERSLRSAAIEDAWASGQWEEVRNLCETALVEEPGDLAAAEKLVAVSRRLGDTLATIRYLTLLGDLMITLEDLEGALACFRELLQLDPGSATARRRLARFREMKVPGADRIPEGCRTSIRGGIDTADATVSVKEAGGVETEEWIDLTTLLQEFHAGVREQMKPDDYAGHYDLGLSHQKMGLYEEALEEFDLVLTAAGSPPDVEMKAREMRGTCLRRLNRFDEAIQEYRAALEIPDQPEGERNAVLYQLACALEAAGEVAEARSLFRNLAGGSEPVADAREHLERLGG